MRYFISNNTPLFENDAYDYMSVEESLRRLSTSNIWGVDTETKGFDPYTKDLLLVQIGNYEDQFAIDCSTINITLYKSFFENPNNLLIFHNAKFDLRFFLHKRIIIPNVYDTFLGEKLLWLGYPSGIHGLSLASCAKDYLNVDLDKSVRGEIHKGLTTRVIIYGCDDVKYLIPIRDFQLKKLKNENLLTAIDIECNFVKVLAYIEYSGLKLDKKAWLSKMKRDKELLDKYKLELDQWVIDYNNPKFINKCLQGDLFLGFPEAQCNINWNSSKQVAKLFKELGFNLLVKDKDTGQLKDSIESGIIESQKHISTVSEPYLKYSAAFKVVSTYGESFIKAINPISERIHTQFNQLMDTTRLSCGGTDKDTKQENINFQNIPSDAETRSCFISEEGYSMICCDYSAQEDYIFTEISQESKLVEFYNDKTRKRDGHSFVAKMIYHEELKDIEEEDVKKIAPKKRSIAKSGKFALHYGGNGTTVATNLNIPIEEGLIFEKMYFEAFPGIRNYFSKVKKDSWDRGYILISKLTGHKAYIYDWGDLKKLQSLFNTSFWEIYREKKLLYTQEVSKYTWKEVAPKIRKSIIRQMIHSFINGKTIRDISNEGEFITGLNRVIKLPECCLYIEFVKYFFSRKGATERMSLNYPIQGTSAQVTKIACIKYYNHLINDNLLFIVKIPNIVHDEIEVECPDKMIDVESKMLQFCMESAGDIFCKTVKLKAVPEIGKHWIH